jgi:hypothetical protein
VFLAPIGALRQKLRPYGFGIHAVGFRRLGIRTKTWLCLILHAISQEYEESAAGLSRALICLSKPLGIYSQAPLWSGYF